MATVAPVSRHSPTGATSHAPVAFGLVAMVVLALVTRLPFWGHPAADYDEQLYSLVARHWLAGEWPYVGLWDRKPPGLFAIYAAAHALLGSGPVAYQAAALAACLAGGWLTFRIATRIAAPGIAAFAAAAYPPLMAIYGSHSGQSEVFLTPLLAGMALQALRAREAAEAGTALRRQALAMALGGLALQVKYSALPTCLWFGAVALRDLHGRGRGAPALARDAALFAALGLLPTLAFALPYLAGGASEAFVFANFESIRLRAAMPLALTLGRQASDFAPLAALALAGWLRRRVLPAGARQAWNLMAGWLLAGCAGLFLSTTIYTYYYAALAPAVIVVALPLFVGGRPGVVLLALVPAWLTAVFDPPAKAATARAERETLARMARAIGTRCLYVHDGPLALYTLTGSPLPTRFVYPDHLSNALEARALPVDPAREVARIMAAGPQAVVTAAQPVGLRNGASAAVLAQALSRGFRQAGSWTFQQRRINLFIAKDFPERPNGGCRNSVSKSSKLRPYDEGMAATGLARRAARENGIGTP
ncbi:MAG: hypothetical protein KGM17_07240 [Sphingomonadales bacterium]|nr:hypothetical protein [Sphingomonadales bacterium]